MRYIDAFNHFSPKRYFDALVESPAGQKDIGKRVRGIPALYDLELRLKVVDQYLFEHTDIFTLRLQFGAHTWQWRGVFVDEAGIPRGTGREEVV